MYNGEYSNAVKIDLLYIGRYKNIVVQIYILYNDDEIFIILNKKIKFLSSEERVHNIKNCRQNNVIIICPVFLCNSMAM